jgi:hypothetical protein
VDPALNRQRGVLTQLKAEGRVIRYPAKSVFRTDVEKFELRDPDTAVLTVCIVDDGERYDAASGALLTDGKPGTSRWEIAMRQVDGSWRVAEQVQRETWDGISGCAA